LAKFVSNIRFKDKETEVTHEAGEEFEMTVKRSKELTENINRDYPELGFELKRTDLESD
jgi:phosphopantothenoylcysteine synthetase/decarboxylase